MSKSDRLSYGSPYNCLVLVTRYTVDWVRQLPTHRIPSIESASWQKNKLGKLIRDTVQCGPLVCGPMSPIGAKKGLLGKRHQSVASVISDEARDARVKGCLQMMILTHFQIFLGR